MIREIQFRALPEQAYSEDVLKQAVCRFNALDVRTVNAIRILKKSIDARQRTIYVNLTLRLFINEDPTDTEYVNTDYHSVDGKPNVIEIGRASCRERV